VMITSRHGWGCWTATERGVCAVVPGRACFGMFGGCWGARGCPGVHPEVWAGYSWCGPGAGKPFKGYRSASPDKLAAGPGEAVGWGQGMHCKPPIGEHDYNLSGRTRDPWCMPFEPSLHDSPPPPCLTYAILEDLWTQ
jgi:hypothetical protein